MACYQSLSVFARPYKFGARKCVITRLDFTNARVENIELTDPADYIALPDCKFPMELCFLNKKGGTDRFVFTFKQQLSSDIGDGRTFQDQDQIERYTYRGVVRQRVQVESQFISIAARLALEDLLESIQAWEIQYTEGGDPVMVPIKIDSGSYPKYKSGDKQTQVIFSFTYGQITQVQTQ